MTIDDIEMRSSCASKDLHYFMVLKEYERAKEILRKYGQFEGPFEEAWAVVEAEYSASKMELQPTTVPIIDHLYLVRVGGMAFVATARQFHREREKNVRFYCESIGEFLPLDKVDELIEIKLTK